MALALRDRSLQVLLGNETFGWPRPWDLTGTMVTSPRSENVHCRQVVSEVGQGKRQRKERAEADAGRPRPRTWQVPEASDTTGVDSRRRLGIVVDDERFADHVVSFEGATVLLIDPELTRQLADGVFDFKSTPEGTRFTLDAF